MTMLYDVEVMLTECTEYRQCAKGKLMKWNDTVVDAVMTFAYFLQSALVAAFLFVSSINYHQLIHVANNSPTGHDMCMILDKNIA